MTNQTYTNFKSNKPKVEAFLPHGEDAEKLYNAYKKELGNFLIKDWSRLKYNPETKEIYNANNIDQGIINSLLKDSGVRVAVPRDNFNRDIYNLIEGKHYAEFNANAVHEKKTFL